MSVVNQINHYQQSIEKCSNDESRLLHCIEKLYKLPVTVQHLQDTGVGRTVNALRKYDGTVGDAAKALVAKWKTMVVDEESSEADDDEDQNHPDVPEGYSDNSDLGIEKSSPDQKSEKDDRNTHKRQESKHRSSSDHSRAKENSRSENEKKSRSSHENKESRKEKERDRSDKISKSSREKEKSSRDETNKKSHRSESSKKPLTHQPKENKEINGTESSRKRKQEASSREKIGEKRRRSSTTESSDSEEDEQILPEISSSDSEESLAPTLKLESPPPKSRVEKDSKHDKSRDKSRSKSKSKKSDKLKESSKSRHHSSSSREKSDKRETSKERKSESKEKSKRHKSKNTDKPKVKKHLNGNEGIDCNSGASFAEALGMCSAPQSGRKKNAPPSPCSPIMKVKSEPSTSTSKPKIKTENLSKEETLSLLAPNVKLEPLSVDLASTLPEISPNYKPLPVNNYLNSVHRKMEEDRALNDAIYAKNARTKVYSGNKSGYTSVPSLYDLCIRVLIENIDALEATGGVPYDILKPVLEKATPDQLFMLEHHNPYLIDDTDPLWQFHCNREFRNKQREEMESWREMYMRCLDEREAKLKTLTANIKQSIDKSLPVRSTKLAYVDNIVKPPRNVLRKQAKYGTANSSTSTSDLKKKIITGGNSATNISVPPPPMSRMKSSSSGIVKKNKAPLMAKALQLIKGRYKR